MRGLIDSGKTACYTQPERQVGRMLLLAKKCSELNFSQLMAVYEEGNLENARMFWQELSEAELLLRAEESFYSYLQGDFFRTRGAYYAIWEENGRYCSALRIEPYQDGVLLEALETRPDCRRRGYAAMLMQAVLAQETRKIYSHVGKKNIASLRTHEKCGFRKLLDHAVYIDGSVSSNAFTLCKE